MKQDLRHLYKPLRIDSVADKVLLLERHFGALNDHVDIPERQRQQVWVVLSAFVLSKCMMYFKKRALFAMGTAELHQERIFLLYNFITENYPKRSIRFIMSAYRRRFTMFESYRQLLDLGITLEGTITYHTNGTRLVRDYVKFIQLTKGKEDGVNTPLDVIGAEYKIAQTLKGGLKGDEHIKTFLGNCLLFQEATYATRHQALFDDERLYAS